MPGLTVWLPTPGERDVPSRFQRAQALVARGPTDRTTISVESPAIMVGHAGHAGYPVLGVGVERGAILLEGRVYDRSGTDLARQLTTVFRSAFAADDPTGVVAEFVTAADGDFLAVGVSPDGDRVIAFSDALGRLPVYVHDGPAGFVLSRECKVIASIVGAWAFDRVGLAQTFWIGYALGERTHFEGIERLPEAFVLDVRRTPRSIDARRSVSWTYRCDRTDPDVDLERAAAEVAERFAIATAGRARAAEGDAGLVISASGGNDSRAVMAGVVRAALPARAGPAPSPIALTFRRADGGQAGDVRVAERVARTLGLPWEVYDLPSIDRSDQLALAWQKDGLNGVGIAYLMPFLREIVRRWTDRAVILTGDGGDKVFPDLRPLGRSRSLDEVAEAIVADASRLDAGLVERLFDLPSGTLLGDLRHRLDAYPEDDLAAKGIRFQLTERGRKYLFEGEDRTRGLAWAATPFYALSVFEASMAIPPAAKRDYRFYARVQRRLAPVLVELPHADFGLAIVSRRFYVRQAARRLVFRGLGSSTRPLLMRARGVGTAPSGAIVDTLGLLAEATERRAAMLEVIDPSAARSAIAQSSPVMLETWLAMFMLDRIWSERIP